MNINSNNISIDIKHMQAISSKNSSYNILKVISNDNQSSKEPQDI